jgi:hypothetical protein
MSYDLMLHSAMAGLSTACRLPNSIVFREAFLAQELDDA